MPRPTKPQITAEILDCAAGLFARHGFARTSLQQVAEALNYSKPGLLHHYPSKKALYEAVLDKYEIQANERIAKLAGIPEGPERDRMMVTTSVDYAFDSPGMSSFMLQLEREGLAQDPRFVKLGMAVLVSMGIDPAAPDIERMARMFSAMSGASFTARIAASVNLKQEFRQHIIDTAMRAMGHGEGAVVGPAPTS
jgi:AcrR family transcriptional regulator